ncbi:hypothetical protein [Shouchella miscanthi]|uniref:Deoxynucleoside kinase domain-containing protein n=1 Tax=Shouchella miscanthi TaxID=2598861 RepID=A0ABU6NRJ0_9BACI|nr:hypothetical protein [Shouchella miscanthi]
MKIELFGLPCSGKSTIINKIRKSKEGESFKFPSNSISGVSNRLLRNTKKITHIINMLIISPKMSINGWRALNNMEIEDTLKVIKLYVYYLTTMSLLKKSTRGQSFDLYDEGIFQVFWGVRYLSKNKFNLNQFLDLFPNDVWPKLIIVVKVDQDRWLDRIYSRQRKYKNKFTKGGSDFEREINIPGSVNKALLEYDVIISMIDYISEINEIRVIEVDNNDVKDLDEIYKTIFNDL